MRLLLSFYQPGNSDPTPSQRQNDVSRPYGHRIGSTNNQVYYQDTDRSGTTSTGSDHVHDVLDFVPLVPVENTRNSATETTGTTNNGMDAAFVKDHEDGGYNSQTEDRTDVKYEVGRDDLKTKRETLLRSGRIDETHGRAINPVSVPFHSISMQNVEAQTTRDEDVFVEATSDDDNSGINDDHELDDEPWILVAKKQVVNDATANTFEVNRGKEASSVNDPHRIDEDILFEALIQENTHVSLYRNYQEYIQRSNRFPSVEDRVKLYMSTWYNPPIFPCNKMKMEDVDNDPRIHYNYVTQWNAARNEYMTTVILRQSQSVPVNNHNNHKRERLFAVDNIPKHSRLTFAYNHSVLSKLPYKSDAFIDDALRYFAPSLKRLQYPDTDGSISSFQDKNLPLPVPILLQVGDSEQFKMFAPDVGYAITRPVIPIIKKFRYSMEAMELSAIIQSKNRTQCNVNGDQGQPRRISRTVRLADNESSEQAPFRTQPIISIMSHTKRHYGPLSEIPVADRPWHTKLNMAVYRGALTGMNKATVKRPDAKTSTDEVEIQWCQLVPRCNLVLQHGTSKLVDAKITKVPHVTGVTEGDRVKPVLNGVRMEGESMNYHDMLQYKAIIMLEGNDVASGLKWALFSNSVVMMSKPTCTSWAMEELLQPYVHYIPLDDDLTNVEEQVQWMIDHDKEAEQIANNGRLWMTDLIFHPDVAKETDAILDETFRRYMQHFQYNPTLELADSSSTVSELLIPKRNK